MGTSLVEDLLLSWRLREAIKYEALGVGEKKVGVKVKGFLNPMANWVVRHLLGCSCNMLTGFEDQLQILHVLEMWKEGPNSVSPVHKCSVR